jgi:uncharacterized coiled-coil protein SlyX
VDARGEKAERLNTTTRNVISSLSFVVKEQQQKLEVIATHLEYLTELIDKEESDGVCDDNET